MSSSEPRSASSPTTYSERTGWCGDVPKHRRRRHDRHRYLGCAWARPAQAKWVRGSCSRARPPGPPPLRPPVRRPPRPLEPASVLGAGSARPRHRLHLGIVGRWARREVTPAPATPQAVSPSESAGAAAARPPRRAPQARGPCGPRCIRRCRLDLRRGERGSAGGFAGATDRTLHRPQSAPPGGALGWLGRLPFSHGFRATCSRIARHVCARPRPAPRAWSGGDAGQRSEPGWLPTTRHEREAPPVGLPRSNGRVPCDRI